MSYDEIRMQSPFDATLPDGTYVRLIPSVIPVLDEPSLVHFREAWTVRDAEDLTGTDANWRAPLAVDFTPSLALEEAWIETLIRRRAHYSGGVGLPPVRRFLVMQMERVSGSRVFERAVESRAFGTRSEARDGFELLCAEFLAARGYGGEIHLIDRKARHRVATSLGLGISRGGIDPVVADWVLGRRGDWTDGEQDDEASFVRATAGVVYDGVGSLVAVPKGIQTAIDAVVEWAHGGQQDEVSWQRLCAYVEQESLGLHDLSAHMIQAFPPTSLPTLDDLRCELDDDTIREHFDKPPQARVSDLQRIRYFVGVRLADGLQDGDERWSWRFPLEVVARDRRRAVVPRSMFGAMMSTETEHVWYPPRRDWVEVRDELEEEGWILDIEQWLLLSPAAQLQYFRP
jgi:hypothetical protein